VEWRAKSGRCEWDMLCLGWLHGMEVVDLLRLPAGERAGLLCNCSEFSSPSFFLLSHLSPSLSSHPSLFPCMHHHSPFSDVPTPHLPLSLTPSVVSTFPILIRQQHNYRPALLPLLQISRLFPKSLRGLLQRQRSWRCTIGWEMELYGGLYDA
jgi:hypothetical protein